MEKDQEYNNLKPGDNHYRAYVGPPRDYDKISALSFNILTASGLRDTHKILDIGCGSLRLGRLLIPYLNKGHYHGLEPNKWLIDDGKKNELGNDLIEIKSPKFYYQERLNNNVKFDFLFAQSIFSHTAKSSIEYWFNFASHNLNDKGVFIATFIEGETDYDGTNWVYPGCVEFRFETIKSIAAKNNLQCFKLDFHHPRQTWIAICRSINDLTSEIKKLIIKVDKDPIIILGMHRSGTSALTGTLQQSGVFLGNVDKENPFNAKGNREDLFLNNLHESILNYNKGSWDLPPFATKFTDYHRRQRDLWTEHMNGISDNWGFKDPRTILILNLWLERFPNPRFVGIFRHPIAVMKSLRNRNQFQPTHSFTLWERYNRLLLHYAKKYKFPLIEFENKDWSEKLEKVKLRLELDLTNENDFFTSDLINNKNEGEWISPNCNDIYMQLKSLSQKH